MAKDRTTKSQSAKGDQGQEELSGQQEQTQAPRR
jgi:hypothetical protein